MDSAKVYSLRVRPLRSADLSFQVPGILALRSEKAYLQKSISEIFDYQSEFYQKLGTTDDQGQGKLMMDSTKITELLEPHSLFRLQNEISSASLNQIILQRQNAFLEKYKYNDQRIAKIKELFPVTPQDLTGAATPGSKLFRLHKQRTEDEARYAALDGAYKKNSPPDSDGVVTQQQAKLSNLVKYTNDHKISTTINTQNIVNMFHKTAIKGVKDDGTEGEVVQYLVPEQNNSAGEKVPQTYISQTRDVTYPAGQGTNLEQTNTLYYTEYTHPSIDNAIKHEQLQSKLMQEELSDTLYAFQVNNLLDIWQNEMKSLDLEVQKFQIGFIRSFLLSPFPGVVTAVYKDVGESVQAGEPVMRVEDNTQILLVGTINYRGLLRLGDKMNITTDDLFENNQKLTIGLAEVVSIRGHDSDNDVWDIILQCNNPLDHTDKPILPINYNFDRDNVKLTKQ